jgi:hypothetical protein
MYRIIRYKDDGGRRHDKWYWHGGLNTPLGLGWVINREKAKTFDTANEAADEACRMLTDKGAPYGPTVNWMTEWVDVEDAHKHLSCDANFQQ